MRSLIVAALVLATACKPNASAPLEHETYTDVAVSSTGEMYALEPSELAELKRRANAGDSTAAVRVAEHYSFAELDTAQELQWLLVAAELGDIGAMRWLAHQYASDLSGHKNCADALRWLNRAKQEASADELREHGILERLVYVTTSPDACPTSGVAKNEP